jgi:hypothetical protein
MGMRAGRERVGRHVVSRAYMCRDCRVARNDLVVFIGVWCIAVYVLGRQGEK